MKGADEYHGSDKTLMLIYPKSPPRPFPWGVLRFPCPTYLVDDTGLDGLDGDGVLDDPEDT